MSPLYTSSPPLRTPFMVHRLDRDGKLVHLSMNPVWQRWFAQFQEDVEVGLSLAQLDDALGIQTGETLRGTVTQDTVDAVGAGEFGDDYKGSWSARTHNKGNIRSYKKRFYECIVARLAANVDTPDNDATGWELIGSAVTLSAQSQPTIDAIGAAAYGSFYKGKWVADIFAVGVFVSYSGRYYQCRAARTASNTDDPATDTSGWEAVGSSFALQEDISTATQTQIDAAARITYGDDYKGKWAAGVFVVGNVTYDATGEKFYECDTARVITDTTRPGLDTSNWSVLTALRSDISSLKATVTAQSQSNIDAVGYNTYGNKYKGKWAAGTFLVNDYTSHDGRYYKCTTARTSSNTDDPATDNSSWDVVGTSFALEGNIETASQAQIDAAAALVFGDDYTGVWAAGTHVVGAVSYDATAEKFYECDTARTASDTSRPALDTSNWSLIVTREAGVYSARDRAVTSLPSTGKEGDLIWVVGDLAFSDWSSGFVVPSAEDTPTGLTVKSNGNLLMVGQDTRKIFEFTGGTSFYRDGSWDSGFAVPSAETEPRGVAVKSNGNILLAGRLTNKVYEYSNGSWDSGFAVPSAEDDMEGIAVKPNGDIIITGFEQKKIYTYSNGSWDSGFAVPSAETDPVGLAVRHNGDILMVGRTTQKVYIYSNGSWDSGTILNAYPFGLAVTPDSDILVLDYVEDKIRTAYHRRLLDRYVRRHGAWDLTLIRTVE